MFGVPRADLIRGLTTMGGRVCQSGSPATCDCKFGVTAASYPGSAVTDQSGCPELRLAATLFAAMTDREYAALCEAAGVLGVGVGVADGSDSNE